MHRSGWLCAAIWLIITVFLIAPSVKAGFPEVLQAAEQARAKGRADQALDIYLNVLPNLDAATSGQREEVLKGLFATCAALIEANQVRAALRGLIALLPPTSQQAASLEFYKQIRWVLDRATSDLVIGKASWLAIPALKALMADSPGGPGRWALLARAYVETGEFNQAGETIRRGLELFPDSAELLFSRALLAGSLSEQSVVRSAYAAAESLLRDAATDLERAASREPQAAGIQGALGKIRASLWVYYRATGQFTQALSMLIGAEDAYSEADRLDPSNPEPAAELGQLLSVAQDWNWAREQFRRALNRYRALAGRTDLTPLARATAQRGVESCQKNIGGTLRNQALDAINTADFDLARALIIRATQEMPVFAAQAHHLRHLLSQRESAFQEEADLLDDVEPPGDAQVARGDFWMRVRRHDQAQAFYRAALDEPLQNYSRVDVEDRLFGTLDLPEKPRQTRLSIGSLNLDLEAPEDFNLDGFRVNIEKAHARTMGIFPYQLNGPVGVKIFANQRSFLELAGLRLGYRERGFYHFGRIVTYTEPHRTHRQWQTIMVHELAHRYVDEMAYGRAPHWLAEGLALWATHPWSRKKDHSFHALAKDGRLFSWGRLEPAFAENWNDSVAMDALRLQSHQMIVWLVERFSLNRVLALLSGLRQGQSAQQAFLFAFGEDRQKLETRWRSEIK